MTITSSQSRDFVAIMQAAEEPARIIGTLVTPTLLRQ